MKDFEKSDKRAFGYRLYISQAWKNVIRPKAM